MAKRPPLAAGSLRHLITIEESYASGTGRANEQLTSWRTWRRAYAAIRNAPGREYFQQAGSAGAAAGQVRSEQVFRFTCRHHEVDGVDHAMRISFQGSYYNIIDIRPDLEGMAEMAIDARLAK